MSLAPFVPRVLSTVADQTHAAILLDTCIACSMTSVIHNGLNENSAQFCAASIVIALEVLHEVRTLRLLKVLWRQPFFFKIIIGCFCIYYSEWVSL